MLTKESFMPNEAKCAETLRKIRWADGIYCVDCDSTKHSERYVAEDGTHCNTAEAEWSIFKPWWAAFRGVSKKYAHRYLAHASGVSLNVIVDSRVH